MMNQKKLYSLFVITLLLTISACNTMEGAGEDIQKGGQYIEDKANDNK